MAAPRVFVSSTCYDLQEVRDQLKKFIEDFGFGASLGEYGDIFYDYKKHIQDSCKDEIGKCQLFIMIIGNNYGTIYYQHKNKEFIKMPDSVTMQEFKKALDVKIPFHIFINKFVDYDFKNYENAKNKFLLENLQRKGKSNEVSEIEIQEIIDEFNKSYPYPQDSYKYVFHFVRLIYDLKVNNSVITFERFDEIKEHLRKQWAGLMYDSLSFQKSVSVNLVEEINDKIDKIESQLKRLVEGTTAYSGTINKITIDVSKMVDKINIDNFNNIKDSVNNALDNLLEAQDYNGYPYDILRLKEEVEKEDIQAWLNSLPAIMKKFKWFKEIDPSVVFASLQNNISETKGEILDNEFLDFYSISENLKQQLSQDEMEQFLDFLVMRFNQYYDPPSLPSSSSPFASSDDDNLPF